MSAEPVAVRARRPDDAGSVNSGFRFTRPLIAGYNPGMRECVGPNW